MAETGLNWLRRLTLRLGIAAGLATFTMMGSSARAAPAAHELSAADLDEFFDPLMADQLARLKIAGSVVVIAKDGAVVFARGYGYADVENHRSMTADSTLVRPGSISKLFTGIAVMQLVEQGRLDLDRDANEYLDFHIPVPDGGVPVTLRRLMTHRAGFEEHVKGLFSADRVPEPLGQWLARALPRRLFPAGDVPAYSNYGMALAGYVVERTAGEPYADYVASHILAPLGMSKATFQQPLPEALAPLMAKSYRRSDRSPWPFFETITAVPAGALSATGLDMGRFMLALLHGGSLDGARVLSEDGLARMMAPQVTTPAGSMGLVFTDTTLEATRLIGHGGGTMSFFSALLLSPENGWGLFVCYDGAAGPNALANLLRGFGQRYLSGSPEQSSPVAAARSESTRGILGVYQTSRRADSTMVRVLALTSEILVRSASDTAITMRGAVLPFGTGPTYREVGERLFRGPNGIKIAFERTPSHATQLNIGPPVMQWQRVPWYLDVRLVAAAVFASVLVGVGTLIAWPIAAILRHRRGQRWSEEAWTRHYHLAARLVLILQIVVIIAAAALFVAGSVNLTILNNDLDPVLVVLYAGAWLSVLGAALTLWIACRFWWGRIGGWWTRLHHALIAASTVTLAWLFVNWHIAGTTLNY